MFDVEYRCLYREYWYYDTTLPLGAAMPRAVSIAQQRGTLARVIGSDGAYTMVDGMGRVVDSGYL